MRRLLALFSASILIALLAAPAASAHGTTFETASWSVVSAARNDDGSIKTNFELYIQCANADAGSGSMMLRRRQEDGSYQPVSGIYHRGAHSERVRKSVDLPPGDYQTAWDVVGCTYEGDSPDEDTGPHSDYRSNYKPGSFTISCPPPSGRAIGGYPLVPVAGCDVQNTTPPPPPPETPPCRPVAARGLPGFPLVACRPSPTPDPRGRVGQRVVCSVERCTGTVTLRTVRRVPCTGRGFPIVPCRGYATRRRVVTLGKARFDIPAGRAKTVKVRLKRRQLRYLKAVRRLKVRMIVSGRSGEERLRTERTFTLRSR
jgi:hypothetical protein